MRKIIVNLAVSLDGLIEGPNGEYDWCIMEPEIDFDSFLDSVDTVLFGRKSYEVFLQEVAKAKETGDALMKTIAEKQKVVFSHSAHSIEGADMLINTDIVDAVRALQQQVGKDIWFFGGANLLNQFIQDDLVDVYMLGLHPIVLGKGKALFSDVQERIPLKLTDTKSYASGLVMLTYERG